MPYHCALSGQNFFLLRGNHEGVRINYVYNFYNKCKRCYLLSSR